MPTRKNLNPRGQKKEEAIVPQKEKAFKDRKPLQMAPTGQTEKPRINALATAGKKKKPK